MLKKIGGIQHLAARALTPEVLVNRFGPYQEFWPSERLKDRSGLIREHFADPLTFVQ